MDFPELNNLFLLAADTKEAGSDSIIKLFGISVPKMLAQFVTVGIVFFILQKFAFGPITEILAARRERIREADERAARIEKELAETQERNAIALKEANERADRLIAEAKESAEALAEAKRQEATRDAANLIEKANAAAAAEREQLAQEIKKEFGKLVVDTTAAVSGKVLNADDQNRLNAEATKALPAQPLNN